MERILMLVPLAVFIAAVFVGARLYDRRRLRKAVEAHGADIQAFADAFDAETSRDREAISGISRWREGETEVAFVYLKRGGWFRFGMRTREDRDEFSISIHGVGGRSLDHFPPYGTRYDAPWFAAEMAKILRIIDVWPRPWTRSGRAARVIAGGPDPLEVAHHPS